MRSIPRSCYTPASLLTAIASASVLVVNYLPATSLAEGEHSGIASRSSSSSGSTVTDQGVHTMPVLGSAIDAATHAAGKASRLFHGSMMVEGELMSSKKPMSPFSGQEVSDSRLPNPFPDPYAHEPERPSTVNIRTDCPYTAEPDTQELLAAGYITPNELHYVRNHLPAPVLKAEDYTLTIEGPGVGQPRQQQQQHGVEAQLADLNVGFGGSGNQSKPGLDQAASAAAEAAVVGSAAYNEPAGTGLLCQEANISRAAAAAGSNHLSSNSSSRVGKVELQLSDLQQQFAQHTVVATLQCAGNRRNDMRRFKEVKGGPWEAGGIGTSAWSGPWLRDVLASGGADVPALLKQYQQLQQHKQQQFLTQLNPTAAGNVAPAGAGDSSSSSSSVIQHVWFEGHDNAGPDTHFLVSIPLDKALSEDGDVMLAVKMNGQDIPGQHGYPVRVLVPGHVGTRSCKWLRRIVLSADEAPSHWQQTDYKMLPPNADWQVKANWQCVPAIQAMPVQSAVLSPMPGASLTPDSSGCIEASGYAWSGGGLSINRVEVTVDGGQTWTSAELLEPGVKQPDGRAWGWVLWKARVPVSGLSEGVVRVGLEVNAALGAGIHAQNPDNANDGGRGLTGEPKVGGIEGSGEGAAGAAAEGAADGEQVATIVALQCKAVDSRNNTQPSDVGSIWNTRGCGCNSWHTVQVTVRA